MICDYIYTTQDVSKALNYVMQHDQRDDVRRQWSEEEDLYLRELVEKYGESWSVIASFFKNKFVYRSNDSIRNRWKRNMGVKIKYKYRHSNINTPKQEFWTKCEDNIILEFIKKYGKDWNNLAKKITHRSRHAIRNRYSRLVHGN